MTTDGERREGDGRGLNTDGDSSARSNGSIGRRAVLGGVTGLAASSVAAGSASAFWGDSSVPEPDVEGPIEDDTLFGGPAVSAPHDIDEYDYVEEEYFISGDARSSDYFDGKSWRADEESYKTRVLVYRPEDEDAFNGHVLADWMNVTTQLEMPVTWANAHDYLMREGYAVALVSAQRMGIDDSNEGFDLHSYDDDRYGDLHHPGDDFALDIFSQVIAALRAEQEDSSGWFSKSEPHPLGDLEAEYVLATGQSQSAFYMLDYINDVQPEYELVDGFLPAASDAMMASDDLVPVLWLNTEDEAEGLPDPDELDLDEDELGDGIDLGTETGDNPRDDSGLFKLWEVAGASHVNVWLSTWSETMVANDFEGLPLPWDPDAAGDYGQQDDGDFGDCQGNYFPMRYAYSAALEALRSWVEDGEEPAEAPRIERDSDDNVVTDEYGNAKGGIRLPPIEAPVAEYDANSCLLEGQTFQLEDETLEGLYDSDDDYLEQFEAAADDAVSQGYLLQADADDLVDRAAAASVVDDDDDDDSDFGWW